MAKQKFSKTVLEVLRRRGMEQVEKRVQEAREAHEFPKQLADLISKAMSDPRVQADVVAHLVKQTTKGHCYSNPNLMDVGMITKRFAKEGADLEKYCANSGPSGDLAALRASLSAKVDRLIDDAVLNNADVSGLVKLLEGI